MANLPNDLASIQPDILDAIANEKGKEFKPINTNQIRNVFAHINTLRTDFRVAKTEREQDAKDKIYSQVKRDLILLKPKLAYAAGRKNVVRPFQEFLFDLIDKTTNSTKIDEALENFFVMVESVVAYHKFYGGKEN